MSTVREGADGATLKDRVEKSFREDYDTLVETARTELARLDGARELEPEDLVARAVFKAITGEARCDNPDRMASFLKGLIRGQARNLRKSASDVKVQSLDDPDSVAVRPSPWSDPFLALLRVELWRRARERWERLLTQRQRQVFLMKELEGMKVKEIAEELDLAPGTVKVHLREARGRLKASGE